MLYRKVPKNGDKLSVLGYGCMRLPVKMQSINEKRAEKQILYAMDRGVNYFDTAAPYHNGKSEPFLGKVLARNNCRDRVKIATKLPHWQARSKADMDKLLEAQLEKLKTDRIDYYLIHALNGELWETAKRNGVIEFMDDALQQGKIINAGFSNCASRSLSMSAWDRACQWGSLVAILTLSRQLFRASTLPRNGSLLPL